MCEEQYGEDASWCWGSKGFKYNYHDFTQIQLTYNQIDDWFSFNGYSKGTLFLYKQKNGL